MLLFFDLSSSLYTKLDELTLNENREHPTLEDIPELAEY
jgi:hypothetical protein